MIAKLRMSRRTFVAAAAATTLAACGGRGSSTSAGDKAGEGSAAGGFAPLNPLVKQRADAQIFRHTDGNYYMTASVPEYDRLILRRAPTLAGLSTAEEVVIWRRPTEGKMGGHIWAPELHEIDGRWYMYFAAGNAGQRPGDVFEIRTYVLQGPSGDVFKGEWSVLGQLETPWDSFNLDSTVFVHKGVRYICWAQREPGIDTNSNLYLAPLKTPTTLGAAPVRLTVPTLPWEIQGFKVAEAPAFLARNGKVFLTYSASATDSRYCLGLLTADEDADLMSAESWTKSPEPVFVTSELTGVYGPGHNSFTVDEQGRDVLIYHGRDYKDIVGDPLYDPNRHTRMQRLYYRPDGTPDFGIPVGNGEVPDRFTPASQPGVYLRHEDGKVLAGEGPLPDTQFRQKPGLAGEGTVSLEPVTAPGRFLRRLETGEVVIAENDGTATFAEQASFRRTAGLTEASGVSFAAVELANAYLRVVDGRLQVGAPASDAERAAGTFLIS